MLVHLSFSINIDATPEHVWYALWNPTHYKNWTSAFSEQDSFAKTDWAEGSNVHFVNAEDDGIYAKIETNKALEKMVFAHIGGVVKGIEQGPDKTWDGAKEAYHLKVIDGKTQLLTSIDTIEDYRSFFEESFPIALEKVKTLAEKLFLNISAEVSKPVAQVWERYNHAEHIVHWNFADVSWHCPSSKVDLKVGGKFNNTMAAKDGSFSFDFEGTYTEIEHNKSIKYTLTDDRKVTIDFEGKEGKTIINCSFQPENENTLELQEGGWQAILNNFKAYSESQK
jgi:uncharacterized protein YndB with AHSA1/START domain